MKSLVWWWSGSFGRVAKRSRRLMSVEQPHDVTCSCSVQRLKYQQEHFAINALLDCFREMGFTYFEVESDGIEC